MPDLMDDTPPTRCTGRVKSTGDQCRLNAIPGGTVCAKWHGGKAPQVAKAAEKRVQKKRIERAMVVYGLPVETTAEDALFDELYRSRGAVEWLQEKVQAMAPGSLIWGKTGEVEADKQATEFPGVDTSVTYGATVHVWLDLYQKERKHYFDVAKTIAALNLEERRVRIDETKATVLTDVLRAVLAKHGVRLGDEQVAADVRAQLRLITGGAA